MVVMMMTMWPLCVYDIELCFLEVSTLTYVDGTV